MSAEFAGTLRERVEIYNRGASRDVFGGATGDWESSGATWAAIAPLPSANPVSAETLSAMPRWQVTMRWRADVGVATRLSWRGEQLAVRSVTTDPRDPARMELICEELR